MYYFCLFGFIALVALGAVGGDWALAAMGTFGATWVYITNRNDKIRRGEREP